MKLFKHKLAEWVKRYLPAEILSTAVTLLSAWLVRQHGGSPLVLALISTWSGNISYFGYMFTFEINSSLKAHRQASKDYTSASLIIDLRGLLVEFGFAELLDSFLIRPVAMYTIPLFVPDFTAGIIAAKLTADIVFYIPAIVGYELNKKYLK